MGYLPFGPATAYSFAGNGQALDKLHDANYRVTDIEGSALNLHFKLDALGDITAEGNAAGVPTPNESYLYDPLDRLLQVDGSTGAAWQRYTYDKTGDRLSKVMAGAGTDTYGYTPNTHHLIGIAGYDVSKRAMDANGNTTAFQANGWTYGLGYNDANRLASVQQNGTTVATYGLNGIGERVTKILAGGGTQSYVYDESGKLLGEYAAGQSRDYVWADGTLVAILDNPAQGGSTLHYVYTDNLGTPRAVTTPTGTVVWDWPYNKNPFGEAQASGNGYMLNLRFPGQYFDAETGLVYNGNRDFEPGTGRYIQSDPIGLANGPSTYIYAFDAPLEFIDPSGTSGFGTGGFVGNYFGNGAPVDLSDVGLLGAFRTSQSVMSATSSFEAALESDIEAKAKSMCSGCNPSGERTISLSRNDKVVTDVTNEPGLFAIGHSTFFRSGNCTLNVDCQTRTYMLRCMFLFSIRDKFTDPLDGSRIGHPFDLPFSAPYPITATFSNSINMEGGF